jgi:RHS repeat-associated protein
VRRVRRGYTGHEHDPETGLVNMGARLYDNVTARFMAPDPGVQVPGWTQSWNRFSYAWNSPHNWVDPFGLENEQVVPDEYGLVVNATPPASPTSSGPPSDLPVAEVPPPLPGPADPGMSPIETPAPLAAPATPGAAPDVRTSAEAPGADTNEEFGPPAPPDLASQAADLLWTTPLHRLVPIPGAPPVSAQTIAEGNRETVCGVLGGGNCSGRGGDAYRAAGTVFYFLSLGRGGARVGVDIVGKAGHRGLRPTQLAVDRTIVEKYAAQLRAGAKVAPIHAVEVPGGQRYITEGHHRYVASVQTGIPVEVVVTQGGGPVGFDWAHVVYEAFAR